VLAVRLPILALVVASLVLPSCGGGQQKTTTQPSFPDAAALIPVAPAPQPTATPLPGTAPTLDPLPARPGGGGGGGTEAGVGFACGEPSPPAISRVNVKIHANGGDRLLLDSTPLVGPDAEYCKRVGFSDGRSFCPVRAEGSPDRIACEAARVGTASDTGRSGPTWSANGHPCDSADSGSRCQNHGDNQYLVWAYGAGTFRACTQSGVCGELQLQ
jgi:hypothetical protein